MRKARTNKKPLHKRRYNVLMFSASLRFKHHLKHVFKLFLVGGFQSVKVCKSAYCYLLKCLLRLIAYLLFDIGICNRYSTIRHCIC